MKSFKDILGEAKFVSSADFKISPSGRKVHKMKKIADDDYEKKDDDKEEVKEAVDKQEQRFIQLARLGLVDKSDVSKLRIAMDQLKADKPLTMQQRGMLLSVMSDLVGLVTGDDTIFQRVKMDLQKEETEIIEEDSVLVEYDSVNGRYVHKAKPGNYGGSAKDKHVVDTLSGPKKSELKDIEDKKKVKEEVELDEGQMKRLATDAEEDKRTGSWRKETPWMKAKDTTTDKSGAKHTPMSTAKHLARLALKKQQSKTPQSK
jgi:hypothetical protein